MVEELRASYLLMKGMFTSESNKTITTLSASNVECFIYYMGISWHLPFKFVKSGFWTKRTPIETIYSKEEGSKILTMLYPPKLMMH
jgi:hypothetical protein